MKTFACYSETTATDQTNKFNTKQTKVDLVPAN